MEVGPIDADIAQSMLVERRELGKRPPVGGANPGASPPQPEHADASLHYPRSVEVGGDPGSAFAGRSIRSHTGWPETARCLGELTPHSKIFLQLLSMGDIRGFGCGPR
jgi:hypothetical protein